MVEYFVTKGKLVVRNGEPLVVVEDDGKALSQVEFILWTSLHWNLMNKESLKAEFDRRMKKYGLYGDVSFEQTLNRLKTRDLIVSKSDYLAVDALYNLVKDLYVVPLGTVNRFKRAIMFSYMFVIKWIPLDECREIMEDFNINDLEKQIVGFSKRLKVSVAELIRINDKNLWDIKSEDDIIPLAYEENESRTAIIKQGNDEIRYTVYQPMAYLNGEMMVMDTYGILKDRRTLVPIRFISELLGCTVVWDEKTSTVVITSPKVVTEFPEPEISVNYPESISDKRLLWIDLLNYRDFQRSGDYEFKIEFLNPIQFNTYEQDEGAINGWQKYSRCNFVSASNSYKTIYSITRAFYTTRDDMNTYKPNDGDEITFRLTVRNKTTIATKEYIFTESLKLPYDIEN